ncbi:MAG: energy-coupling factor ABC transporter ATP-binding protein, partial [Planctomycetota bacterium]|nr:energy-coupling factor ABC transporter ATP-binding protein [Planctomycetota bacterium]
GLEYTYSDGTPALRGVSFRIVHGECVGIIGANGAGKSTLLMLIAGCVLPSGGELLVGGFPASKGTLPRIRRAVGFVFQDPDDQLFMPTVGEDAAFGPLNAGLPPEEAERRASEALGSVGVLRLRDRPPYRMSGGEKRCAAIACVLAMSPDILVLDEPTSGLDPRARRTLTDLLRRFTHTRLIATHDLDFVLDICDRVIVLCDGRIVSDGPVRSVLADGAALKEWGLDLPRSAMGCPFCSGRDVGGTPVKGPGGS